MNTGQGQKKRIKGPGKLTILGSPHTDSSTSSSHHWVTRIAWKPPVTPRAIAPAKLRQVWILNTENVHRRSIPKLPYSRRGKHFHSTVRSFGSRASNGTWIRLKTWSAACNRHRIGWKLARGRLPLHNEEQSMNSSEMTMTMNRNER